MHNRHGPQGPVGSEPGKEALQSRGEFPIIRGRDAEVGMLMRTHARVCRQEQAVCTYGFGLAGSPKLQERSA
jgi:hypothetical protein